MVVTAAGGEMAVPHPRCRIESVASTHSALCECGWASTYEPSVELAYRAWERHSDQAH